MPCISRLEFQVRTAYRMGCWAGFRPRPLLPRTSVLNGASHQPAIAPNTWVTIKERNLSATVRVWDSDDLVHRASRRTSMAWA